MKKPITCLSFVLLIVWLPLKIHGQALGHELGVAMKGLNNFDLIYKKQKDEHRYKRLNFGFIDLSLNSLTEAVGFSVGLSIGIEKRSYLAEHLELLKGWQPGLQVQLHNNDIYSDFSFTPSIGYLVGVKYEINNRFYASIEMVPSLSASLLWDDRTSGQGTALNASFNTNDISLGIVYRFTKEDK